MRLLVPLTVFFFLDIIFFFHFFFLLQVTAFGGGRVINLLQAIERHRHRFKRPPIGPIGAHVVK